MRGFLALTICAVSLGAAAQSSITYPYNPDVDASGQIGNEDILGFLQVYSQDFSPGEPTVSGCLYSGWAIPLASSGPAQFLSNEPLPEGYQYATHQSCAAEVIQGDAYCINNSWDGICQNTYDACILVGGCEMTLSDYLASLGAGQHALADTVSALQQDMQNALQIDGVALGEVLTQLIATQAAMQQTIAEQHTYITQLQQYISIDGETVLISGANLQVVSGEGSTEAPVNGTGNIIVGYDENTSSDDKSGSHNLVIGWGHTYSSHGGIVVGNNNAITKRCSSILGGRNNTASGEFSSVSGGYENTASGTFSSVSGGYENTASEFYSSISGGYENTASGYGSSVSGGDNNVAFGWRSSVSGGYFNTALGANSSVSGGTYNTVNEDGYSASGQNDIND